MVSRVQLSATTSRPLVLRQDPDADLSRYTTTGKGKTHGGMTTGDSHMGFKTASTVCPIKSQLIQVKFGAERLCTGCLNRTEPIGQNRAENVDHLPITVIDGGELATNALDSSRQHPVLKGCAIAQRSRLARQDRHIMPGIVNRLAAPETAPMLGDNFAMLSDQDPVGVSVYLHRATQRLRHDRVLVVVKTDKTGLRDGGRNRVESVKPPGITNEAWPLGLEDRPDC